MKKKFVLPGVAAFAAAALSLCLGGGVAHAQETADLPAAPVQTHSLHAANLNPLSVPQEEGDGEGSSPNVPVGDILSFLSDSIYLVGRDVLGNIAGAGAGAAAGAAGAGLNPALLLGLAAKAQGHAVASGQTPADGNQAGSAPAPQLVGPDGDINFGAVFNVFLGHLTPSAIMGTIVAVPAFADSIGLMSAVVGSVVGAVVGFVTSPIASMVVNGVIFSLFPTGYGMWWGILLNMCAFGVGVLCDAIGMLFPLFFGGLGIVINVVVVGLCILLWPLALLCFPMIITFMTLVNTFLIGFSLFLLPWLSLGIAFKLFGIFLFVASTLIYFFTGFVCGAAVGALPHRLPFAAIAATPAGAFVGGVAGFFGGFALGALLGLLIAIAVIGSGDLFRTSASGEVSAKDALKAIQSDYALAA